MRYTHGCSVLHRTTARTVTPPIIPVVKNDADFSNFDARFTNLVGVVFILTPALPTWWVWFQTHVI